MPLKKIYLCFTIFIFLATNLPISEIIIISEEVIIHLTQDKSESELTPKIDGQN